MLPLPRDPVRLAEANINHLQTIFCLRSRTACSGDIPIAAELYSGTFVIYSTKKYALPMAQLGLLVFTLLGLCACCMGYHRPYFTNYASSRFPGLQASTALTKHLTRWGVRANIRSNDRRKQTEDSSEDELVQAPNDSSVGPPKIDRTSIWPAWWA